MSDRLSRLGDERNIGARQRSGFPLLVCSPYREPTFCRVAKRWDGIDNLNATAVKEYRRAIKEARERRNDSSIATRSLNAYLIAQLRAVTAHYNL